MGLRIATFNVENLDEAKSEHDVSLATRAPLLRRYLQRLDADVLCLQEVHGQELPDHTSNKPKRSLSALDKVVAGTRYAEFHRSHTRTTGTQQPYDKRNLVVLSRHPLGEAGQFRNDKIPRLEYKKVTARPPEVEADELRWERPILHVPVTVPGLGVVHVINLHLKSRLASNIPGQKLDNYTWSSAAGWAEGYFLSSVKRVGQALETRVLVDELFDADPNAHIVVCGDFNAEPGQVPVEAICGAVENTNNPALRSRVLVPCSAGVSDSNRFTHLHHGQGNLLDHMLISQSLLAGLRGVEIHNENLHDESLPFRFDSKYPESDHAPFVAQFEF